MATKSKNVSVSKAELEQTAVAAAVVAEDKIEEGLIDLGRHAEFGGGEEGPPAGRGSLAAGVSDVTHGVDQMIVADKLAMLSEVVGAAGSLDVAEGVEALVTSEDIDVQSTRRRDDERQRRRPRWSCRPSGQLAVAADFVASAGDAGARRVPGG